MTTTLKRPPDVDEWVRTHELDDRPISVKEPERPGTPPPSEPRFVRWLAWIVVSIAVLGTSGVIWWAVASPSESEPVAPPIENIDPHESPEILAAGSGVVGLEAAVLQDFAEQGEIQGRLLAETAVLRDFAEQGEIQGRLLDEAGNLIGVSIESIDPHESPEILRAR